MRNSPKALLQGVLRQAGLYHRLKCSCVYDLYWGMANRKLIDDRRKELKFYREILRGFRKGDLIFDIGANQGQKTSLFLNLGARIVAVEPDPFNQEVLRQSFLTYRWTKKPVTIVGKAVSDRVGIETLWINEPGSAMNTLNPKWVETLKNDSNRFGETLAFAEKREVQTTTLEELVRSYGQPFYVKIDVEGHEVGVLKGLKRPVPFVSFEVNLPEFKVEAVQCIELLEGVAEGEFNYSSDCRRGLALDRWVTKKALLEILENCEASSIEVYWRAPNSSGSRFQR